MANKININDYGFDFSEARIYVAFMVWLTRHPNGGIFNYEGYELKISAHDSPKQIYKPA